MRPRSTSGPELSGLAARHRTGDTRVARVVAIASIAGATLALSGCTAPDDGVVATGADGENYVIPEGAERPQYRTREECIEDVTEQIEALEAQGEDIGDDPEELCESSESYRGAYLYPWLGPILFAGSRWNSSRVAGWSTVGDRGFAAPGSTLQRDVVSPAPAGTAPGDRAPLKGGFGSTGKSGFAESSGS